MAERAIPTKLLFQSVSKLLKGDAPASLTHLGLDESNMSGYTVATVKFGTETVTREAVSPTLETDTQTDDIVAMSKASWKPGNGKTVYGSGMFTAITGDLLQVFHEWAAAIAFETDDTVTETMKIQSKQGA